MKRLGHNALFFRFEIPSREFEALRGALHLNLFDTSPLQVHTHASILHAYLDISNERTYEDARAGANKLFACAGMRFVTPTVEIKAEGRS